jgi:hypothetical protein
MSELKDVIKKASKNKLIQLAIDSKEFDYSDIPEEIKKLTEEEIDLIRKRAKDEGWDGELYRAKDRSYSIENLTRKAQVELWKALYYLQEYTQLIQKTEGILEILADRYLDTSEDKTKAGVKETKEEIKKEVNRVTSDIDIFTLSNITALGKGRIHSGEENKSVRDSRALIINLYKHYINNAKILTYLVTNRMGLGYRLYPKEEVEELNLTLSFTNILLIHGLLNSLDKIDYLADEIDKHIPEVMEILREEKRVYIPTKEELKELIDYLGEKILYPPMVDELFSNKTGSISSLKTTPTFDREYLLNGADEELIKRIEEQEKTFSNYIKYGR